MATMTEVLQPENMSYIVNIVRNDPHNVKRWVIREFTEDELITELSRRIFEQELSGKNSLMKIAAWLEKLLNVRFKTRDTQTRLS